MKKWLIILILLIFSNSAGFCNVDLKTENEIKQQEKTNDKQVESVTGAAKPIENFEYKQCKGDEKTKACKIEDLIKKDDKNKQELP